MLNEYCKFVRDCMRDRANRLGRPMDTPAIMLELVGEIGEFFNAYKHSCTWRREEEKDTQHLLEELGDVFWYMIACCISLDVDVEEVLTGNMTKLRRRYGDFETVTDSNSID